MTISSQVRTAGPFAGAGVIVAYPFAFKVFQAADVLVVKTAADGTQANLVLSTDYTVSLSTDQNAAPGGSITLLVALPVGASITLTSAVSLMQTASLTNAGGFFPQTIENALDRLTIILQQIGVIGTAQTLRVGEIGGVPPIPSVAARANQLLGFDSSGNPVTVAPVSGSAASLASDLTNTTLISKGAGQVGFLSSLAYTAGTVGAAINSILATAGSSVVGFIQAGAGAVARFAQSKMRETKSVLDFGALGDGATNDAAAINLALAQGGTIWVPDGIYFLGTTQLVFNVANTKLLCARGAKFTVTSAIPANMPQAYLMVKASGCEIGGAVGSIAANPFTVYTGTGAFIGIGPSITGLRVIDCESTNFLHAVFGSGTLTTKSDSLTGLRVKRGRFLSFATDIYLTGKSPTDIVIDGTSHLGPRVAPLNNGGAIGVYGAVDIANGDNFTQSNYDNDCGVGITITNTQVGAMKDRPIRVANCKQVTVANNRMTLDIGSYFTGGAGSTYSADALTFDLCRQVTCVGNTIVGGGENGIDFLSCQDFVCSDNVIKQVNTDAIYVYLSDLWVSSVLTPKLSGVTTRPSLQTKNGRISGNYGEGFIGLYIGAGQNIRYRDNICNPFRTSTNWVTGANTPLNVVVDNASAAAYFTESSANWMHDVFFEGNRQATNAPVSVTHAFATSLFTTVGGVAHNFVTGDKVETVAGGTSLTVDYPAGLDYKVEYYVIRVSATTFKLASTWVNAFAGTAIVTTTNGLTVANSALLVRDAVLPASTQISNLYYTPASNIVLDENIPGWTSVNLFSTLPVIATGGTQFLFTKRKHQMIYDPAVNWGIARNVLNKYFDIGPYASDGTTIFGISDYAITVNSYQFAKGAKPAQMVGSPADGYIKSTFW